MSTNKNQKNQSRKAALGSFIGTSIEWYDYYIYGFAAATVLGPLFFPADSTYMQRLAAFATFGVGFIARPIGGILFGHLGDKFGRKRILVVTLCSMGIITTLIGCLPTYASVGVWAPILLVTLRILQGLSVGGEWGGAVLMAAEHAPPGRQSFFASFAQLGSPAGLIVALLAFRVAGVVDQDVFMDWGWRIPFLLSFALLIVGLLIRLSVEESPEFEKIKKEVKPKTVPLAELWKDWKALVLLAIGANAFGIGIVYLYNTFLISYAVDYIGISRNVIVDMLFWTAVAQFISMPISAKLAERLANDTLFLQISFGISCFAPYLVFYSVQLQDHLWIQLALFFQIITGCASYAIIAGYISQIFPTQVRYTGISVSYQFSAVLAGGLTPMLGTMLAENFKGQWIPVAMLGTSLALISLISVTWLDKMRKKTGKINYIN